MPPCHISINLIVKEQPFHFATSALGLCDVPSSFLNYSFNSLFTIILHCMVVSKAPWGTCSRYTRVGEYPLPRGISNNDWNQQAPQRCQHAWLLSTRRCVFQLNHVNHN